MAGKNASTKKVPASYEEREADRAAAAEEMQSALHNLLRVSDLLYGIERGELSYLSDSDVAALGQYALRDAGAIIEQTMCDLGFIPEGKSPSFVDGNRLKRQRAIAIAPTAEGVANG